MNPTSEIKTVHGSDGPFAPLPPVEDEPTMRACEPIQFDDPDDEEACEDCGHAGPIDGFHTCDDEETL